MTHKITFNQSNPLHHCQFLIFKLSLLNCSLPQFKQLMLKLDPEDSDADMDDLDRSENNKQTPTKQSAQQPMMPQVDFESSIDQLAGGGGAGMMQPMVMVGGNHAQNIPTNLNNVSAFVVQNQYNNNSNQTRREATTTPAGKGRPKGTPKKPATAKKASAAAGKKKKRRISSSEEESDFNSDSDY